MDIIETIVIYETEKAYDVIDTITLSEGDTFKIESDGVEHVVLPVPSGKTACYTSSNTCL